MIYRIPTVINKLECGWVWVSVPFFCWVWVRVGDCGWVWVSVTFSALGVGGWGERDLSWAKCGWVRVSATVSWPGVVGVS